MSAFAVKSNAKWGRHCVATTKISKGEMILFEEPLVLLKAGQTELALSSDAVEWQLTVLLLLHGKREEWTRKYTAIYNELHAEPSDVIQSIRLQLSSLSPEITASDIISIYRTVCCNAFSLDTPILNITFGVAFFEKAAYFNHSCHPNALSLRMGGNMAIFAATEIQKGDQIFHSYVPPHFLVGPKNIRRFHIPFPCVCERCETESHDTSQILESLTFPPDHSTSAHGKLVADFKLSALAEDHQVTLELGDRMFSNMWDWFSSHPIAAIDILSTYLSNFFSFATIFEEMSFESQRWFRECVVLWYQSFHRLVSVGCTPLPLLRHLISFSALLMVTFATHVNETIIPIATEGLSGIRDLYGRDLASLREDIAYLNLFQSQHSRMFVRPLAQFADAFVGKGPAKWSQFLPTLNSDCCAFVGCAQVESNSRFGRCSACKRVKYCSGEHQKSDWKHHKVVCLKSTHLTQHN
eukprot:c9187_g1_i1.p1 GENE.c9187_g1_i1~~c9187_g1_i1.p1  ORF type:complete len:467 (+),score=105.02 c9187_g1_i1:39-1439(+)